MGLKERLGRRPAVAEDVAAAVPTAPGERLLAAAAVDGGGWLVASTEALRLCGSRHDVLEQLAWHEIATASWSDGVQTILAVRPEVRWRCVLPTPGHLPAVVRERVTGSVLASRQVFVPGGRVTVAARRVPGAAEPLMQVMPDDGVDVTAPTASALVREAVEELCRQVQP